MGEALLTDLYGLNMAASYFKRGMEATATFSLFVRQLPPGRGYLVAAGLGSCLEFLEAYRFENEEVEYLASLGFDSQICSRFAATRFTGDVWAVPEGRVVLAGEPLLEVTAPIAEGQLVETFLLNQVTMQTTLATKAARCREAVESSGQDVALVEFGFRRSQGVEAGMAAARGALMTGFSATSNVEAARRFGLRPAGTMAHSYVEAFPSEVSAFRAFAEDIGGQVTFVVDTYDTMKGVDAAIRVIKALGIEGSSAVRLDSGDLEALSHQARQRLDDAGLAEVRIFASGGLDEDRVAVLVGKGAPVDAVGVGTRVATSVDAPYLDSAYKLVEYGGRPIMKLSSGKATLPGAKQVFRRPELRDLLARRHEAVPESAEELLEPVMRRGTRLADPKPTEALEQARARFEADRSQLPDEARRLHEPVTPAPTLSASLTALDEQVRAELARNPSNAPL